MFTHEWKPDGEPYEKRKKIRRTRQRRPIPTVSEVISTFGARLLEGIQSLNKEEQATCSRKVIDTLHDN